MATLYISNAFSPSMLTYAPGGTSVRFEPISTEWVISLLDESENTVSCVGHANTAAVFSSLLKADIPMNRIAVKLRFGDQMIIGTIDQRLPEGATELPEEAEINWLLVEKEV